MEGIEVYLLIGRLEYSLTRNADRDQLVNSSVNS